MKHILDPKGKDRNALEELFKSIYIQEAILFLGAGASITNKKYLSAQIIDYYEEKLGQSFDTKDIVEFVDIMSSNPVFDRSKFDEFVQDLLVRLDPQEHHKIMLSIKWREIITTNYDLLLEKTYDNMKGTSALAFDLVKVRDVKEYDTYPSQDKVKYIKLNGCLSDKSKYKLVFSTADFKRADKFYKKVFNPIKNLSPAVNLITIGYSYSDPLAKIILDKFDKYNYRDGKFIYSLDPYAPDYKLDFFTTSRVCIVKMSAIDFFQEYKAWEEKNYATKYRDKTNKYTNKNNDKIQITNKLSYNLTSFIEQLNNNYSGVHISEKDFYKGEEPNYIVIKNNFDVIRNELLLPVEEEIKNIISQQNNILPVIFLTGTFGTGKTTFNYRLIHNLINVTLPDAVAFEIKEPESMRMEHIIDFVKSIKSEHVIFYCNRIEVDSIYKSIMELRLQLSMQQIPDKSIFFILSIRENILERYKKSIHSNNIFPIKVDASLDKNEVGQLIDRLNDNQIITIRDIHEKNKLIDKIKGEYKGDTFTTLLDLVSDGKHVRNLREAYEELSSDCQEAFLYTALLHRFNLLMPSGLLNNIIASDWNEFTEKVMKVEGKGILIQEYSKTKGVNPDLFFKTKHPQIAERLTKEILKNFDTRLRYYTNIINNVDSTRSNSRLIINLFKSLNSTGEFGERYITKLYDQAYKKFQDDPFFLLSYATNLQFRRTKTATKNAIDYLVYAESLLERKNDKFIHRRAILNFELAKFYYDEEKSLSLTFTHLDEAKDLFLLKRQLDPTSTYSYVDYIQLLLWEMDKIELSEVEEIKLRVNIEDNLTLALNSVSGGVNRILEIEEKYINSYRFNNDHNAYLKRLDELQENSSLIPFICILKYNFFKKYKSREQECNELLQEMWSYKDIDEIDILLFRELGRRLNDSNERIKFYQLSKSMSWYEDQNPLRFNYFNYVASAYNRDFGDARSFLFKIRNQYSTLNPEFKLKWLEADSGNERIFEGYFVKEDNSFWFKSKDFQNSFKFAKENFRELPNNDPCTVKLAFYLSGISAILLTADNDPSSIPE